MGRMRPKPAGLSLQGSISKSVLSSCPVRERKLPQMWKRLPGWSTPLRNRRPKQVRDASVLPSDMMARMVRDRPQPISVTRVTVATTYAFSLPAACARGTAAVRSS